MNVIQLGFRKTELKKFKFLENIDLDVTWSEQQQTEYIETKEGENELIDLMQEMDLNKKTTTPTSSSQLIETNQEMDLTEEASASTSGTQMIEPSQNLNEVEMEDDERQSYSKNDMRCYFKRI